MKIREITREAEDLIEQGENAKLRQIECRKAVESARARLVAAYTRYTRLEKTASETDEKDISAGDLKSARAELFAARAMLEAAEADLAEADRQLELINNRKMEAVREIEHYEAVEEENLSKLQELQKKRSGSNVNAFMADLAARMNSGEQARLQLLRSMGVPATGKSYSEGFVSRTGVQGFVGSGPAAYGNLNETGVKGFFNHLPGMLKKREPAGRRFGSFEIGPHGFVKGDNFEAFLRDWESYDSRQFKENEFDSPEIRTINPNEIEGIRLGNSEISDPSIFWTQHCTDGTADSFKAITALIPEVQAQLASGRSLDELVEDPRLGKCASIYFDPTNLPRVKECDGYYEFQENGRHRILAAREMGFDIPVRVIGTRKRISTPAENT